MEENREELIKRERTAEKDRKREMREGRSFEHWKEDCEQERERKKNHREGMDEIEREFEEEKIACIINGN